MPGTIEKYFDASNALIEETFKSLPHGSLALFETHQEASDYLKKLYRFSRTFQNLSHYYRADELEKLASALGKMIQESVVQKIELFFSCFEVAHKAFNLINTLIAAKTLTSPEIPLLCSELRNRTKQSYEESLLPSSEPGQNHFSILMVPSENVFHTGLDIIAILKELDKIGRIESMRFVNEIPDLEDLRPDVNTIGWEFDLITAKSEDEVRDQFVFLEYDKGSKLEIHIHETEKIDTPVVPTESTISTEFEIENQPSLEKLEQKDKTAPESDQKNSTIRVASGKLDRIMDLVGEIVTAQSRLNQLVEKIKTPEVESIIEEMERLTGELRDHSMNLRMVPASALFKRFTRLVHDLSRDLGKEVEILFEGEETELDKSVIEKITDPMVHLIRNSLDHGIETPEERLKAGKVPKGKIVLSAYQSGPDVFIRIQDDGKGIDLEKVREKGIERGLIKADDQMTEKQLMHLLFLPGFSTSSNVNSVSGRGVGMDVVKTAVEALRGTVDIISKKGRSSTVLLKLPLTLAIIDGLLVQFAGDTYVMPLSVVEECIHYHAPDNIHDSRIINIRGEAVPYIELRQYFGYDLTGQGNAKMVIIRDEENRKVGLVVDEILGQHQTVIKPLGDLLKNRREFSGATILGDGSVALVMDVFRLVDTAALSRPGVEIMDNIQIF